MAINLFYIKYNQSLARKALFFTTPSAVNIIINPIKTKESEKIANKTAQIMPKIPSDADLNKKKDMMNPPEPIKIKRTAITQKNTEETALIFFDLPYLYIKYRKNTMKREARK